MSASGRLSTVLKSTIAIAALSLALSGCAYDYLQHSDRIGYSTGDAVKANLERETTNPSGKNKYNTSGLGKNGVIIRPDNSNNAAPPPP